MTGEDAEGGALQIVIKCNAVRGEQLVIHSLVELSGCELRGAWCKSSRVLPAVLLLGVADRELSLSLEGKRKHGAAQYLGPGNQGGLSPGMRVCRVQ